jgi:hypothetical protein
MFSWKTVQPYEVNHLWGGSKKEEISIFFPLSL